MRRALVTGATGHVGGRIAERLLAGGWAVRGSVRSAEDARRLPAGVEPQIVGDLAGAVDWSAALRGVEAVVHAAGRAHADDNERAHNAINRQATERLAAAAAGVAGRFVFVSSVRAQTGPAAPGRLTEADPPRPTHAYGRAKLAAETALARARDLDVTILRPVACVGPGMGGRLASLLGLAETRWPLPLATFDAPRSLVSTRDLADAAARALDGAPETAGAELAGPTLGDPPRLFLVADPEPLSVAEIVAVARAALGRPPGLFPPPAGAMGVLRAAATRLPAARRALDALEASLVVDPSRLLETGWRPAEGARGAIEAAIQARLNASDRR